MTATERSDIFRQRRAARVAALLDALRSVARARTIAGARRSAEAALVADEAEYGQNGGKGEVK